MEEREIGSEGRRKERWENEGEKETNKYEKKRVKS